MFIANVHFISANDLMLFLQSNENFYVEFTIGEYKHIMYWNANTITESIYKNGSIQTKRDVDYIYINVKYRNNKGNFKLGLYDDYCEVIK